MKTYEVILKEIENALVAEDWVTISTIEIEDNSELSKVVLEVRGKYARRSFTHMEKSEVLDIEIPVTNVTEFEMFSPEQLATTWIEFVELLIKETSKDGLIVKFY